MKFERGNQIAFLPDHAERDLFHKDVEFGFVTSINEVGTIFCRFWNKFNLEEIRTRANSEGCRSENLIRYISKSQEQINKLLEKLKSGEDL